ncbi:MAG: RNA polymerase sigma factor [Actinomycetota bacterium]|nr:sigma-70 family RNA polymerase sigma factor [Actinomycetota bacterium]
MTIAEFASVLDAARSAGEWAWKTIYDEFAPQVLGYLRAKGAKDPDDLLGEVFLQVVRDLPRFSGDEREFRAWVFTIAHHRLLDDVRARGRRPVDSTSDEQLERAGPVGHGEAEAVERLVTSEIEEVLRSLSQDQSEVMLLRILGDMKINEIAETLGKRPGAVQALQRRAIESIKRRLERDGS